jgi:hypothetical protein
MKKRRVQSASIDEKRSGEHGGRKKRHLAKRPERATSSCWESHAPMV